MRQIAILLGFCGIASLAQGEEDVFRAAGGRVEELRAVLDLTPAQVKDLSSLIEKARNDQDAISKLAREKGIEAAREARRDWHSRIRSSISGLLKEAGQKYRYADWLDKKQHLEDEYEKAVFGLPPVSELKLHAGLPGAVTDAIQKLADEGVAGIRKKVSEFKTAAPDPEEVAKAVNELRRNIIEQMIRRCPKEHQKRLTEYIKTWLQSGESKLSKPEHERLSRIMKALAPQDQAADKRTRSLVASVLMHQEEQLWLKRSMAKEVLVALLRPKREADVWTALNEYGALLEVHRRRLQFLSGEMKACLGTKDLGKLVAEGILE